MVLEELINLENPTHGIRAVKTRHLKLEAVVCCEVGGKTRNGGEKGVGLWWYRGDMVDEAIDFMSEGEMLFGELNEEILNSFSIGGTHRIEHGDNESTS